MDEPPLAMRLDVAANKSTPALTSMLVKLLQDAGAAVTWDDPRISQVEHKISLQGLRVHIDRLTWVHEVEAQRWGRKDLT